MNEENNIKFESYFNKTMDASSVKEFEIELRSNSEFQKEYDFFLSVRRASYDIHKDKIRQRLEKINIENNIVSNTNANQKRPRTSSIYKLIGAVAAVLLGIFLFNQIQTSGISNEELFSKNFEIYTSQKSRGTEQDLMQNLPSIDRKELNTPEVKLLYGTLLLQDNKNDEALKVLQDISDDSTFRDQKYWYLGLVQMRVGKTKEAIASFQKLQSMSNYKKNEINDILKQLK